MRKFFDCVVLVPRRSCVTVEMEPREWRPWQPPQDPGQAARESCTMQAIISGAVGGVAGMALGAVLAPFNSSMGVETENLPMKEQFRRGFREMGTQSRSWGKNLMVIGAVFQCSECFVEKTRGTTDKWNPVAGGCITGGALAVSGACTPHNRTLPLLTSRSFHPHLHPDPAAAEPVSMPNASP